MDNTKLCEFFEHFDDQLISLFPKTFTFSDIKAAVLNKSLILNDRRSYIDDENITFAWIEEMVEVINAIRVISKSPKSTLVSEKEVTSAENATRLSNSDLIETSKNEQFWSVSSKSGEIRPSKVYTSYHEDNLGTYENRMVIYVLEKIASVTNKALNYLYSKVRFINKYYVNNKISISEFKTLDSLADFKGFLYSEDNIKARTKANKTPVLTLSDAPYLKYIDELIEIKRKINVLLHSEYFRLVKMASPFKLSEKHVTNIIKDNHHYRTVYNFLDVIPTISNDFGRENDHVMTHAYKDYVLIHLMLSLSSLGYVFSKKRLSMTHRHIIIEDSIIARHPNGVICKISASHRKIILSFEVGYQNGKFHKESNLLGKRTSLINIDVSANISDLYQEETIEELYCHMIERKMAKGFTNAYVVSPYCSSTDKNIIYFSPVDSKVGSHLKNILRSCTVFAEADPFIYTKICPVCGGKINGREEDGNITCPHCNSQYSFLRAGDNFNYKDTIWIKRFKKDQD